MSSRGDKKERTALVAAFLLFAAGLFLVRPAEASRTTNVRSSLAASSSRELASLELTALALAEPIESSPRFGFAEDLGLLDPERRPGGFVVFAAEAAQCELTYARNNPLKYVDPDGREIFAAVHEVKIGPAATGRYHVSILMVPRDQARYAENGAFINPYPRGGKFATLGAGPSGFPGSLLSRENRENDVNLDIKVEYVKVDLGGRDENEVIDALFAADAAYKDNLNYDFIPKAGSDGYNSNSYASGLLGAVGLKPPAVTHTVPGYGKPVPSSAFKVPPTPGPASGEKLNRVTEPRTRDER